jgi:hypothetical protein
MPKKPTPTRRRPRPAARPADPVRLADLQADPDNRRSHPERNLAMTIEALQAVGAARSIVIDEDNLVLAGNGVTAAAAAAGITKLRVVDVAGDTLVAVRRTGLTPAQKRALALYDNRTAELAEWNVEQLTADLQNGEDLTAFFLPDELAELLGTKKKGGLTDPDAIPPARPTKIRVGDLFALGDHRLMCGDSLDAGVVNGLVTAAAPAATVVSSPPYWTGQPYDDHPGEVGVQAFIGRWADTWASRVRRRIQIQTGHTNNTLVGDKGPLRKILLDGVWQAALSKHGWLLRHRRVWTKGGPLLNSGPVADLIDESWELVLTFYRPRHNEGGQERIAEGWAQKGVWSDIAAERQVDGHPCPYPVAIAERMIRLYSLPGDIVAEPFCGAGTTIIACEQLQRRCYAFELSPSYCQVTIDRWEAFTGAKAVKVDT